MKKMNLARLTIGLLLTACVLTQQSALAQRAPRKDFQIALDILNTVNNYDQYGIFDDLTVNVKGGAVTLTGKVTMPHKRDEIEKRVKRVRGVEDVRNQIEVLPLSQFDDDLRMRIANTIYGNANFWQYSTLRKPPIHIIVQGNRVTLTGVVNSDLDRKLAESLARQGGGGQVTNNLKTEDEARQDFEK
jgi:osmotically-inducible protein OsmY